MKKNLHQSHSLLWVFVTILVMLVAMAGTAFWGASDLIYDFVMQPHRYQLVLAQSVQSRDNQATQAWFQKASHQKWQLQLRQPKIKLAATYTPANQNSRRTVIILHGYGQNQQDMHAYAHLFNQLGYNTLTPDARAFGQSQGQVTTYGWLERQDVLKWANQIIKRNGSNSQIVLFGISMGASTALMATGLKLPPQVKAVIADSGYTSVTTELNHELKGVVNPQMKNLMLTALRFAIKRRNGFDLEKADSRLALAKNKLPILIIHGDQDQLVPFKVALENYRATKGPKQLWRVAGAGHAQGLGHDSNAYRAHIVAF